MEIRSVFTSLLIVHLTTITFSCSKQSMFSRTRRTKFFAKSSLLRLVADDAVSTGRRILSTGLALQISKWNRKKAFSLLASLPGIFGRKEADLWNLGIFADFLTRKCRGYPDGKKEISVTYGLAFFVWSHRSPLSYSRSSAVFFLICLRDFALAWGGFQTGQLLRRHRDTDALWDTYPIAIYFAITTIHQAKLWGNGKIQATKA